MPFIGPKPADTVLDSTLIADGSITSAKIADGAIVNADLNNSAAIATSKITGLAASATTDTTNAANIASGTIADARISASSVQQHATSFDDNKLVNDISTLAIRQASNENKAAYNTQSMYVDVFQDATGITNLTNSTRNASEYVDTTTTSTSSTSAMTLGWNGSTSNASSFVSGVALRTGDGHFDSGNESGLGMGSGNGGYTDLQFARITMDYATQNYTPPVGSFWGDGGTDINWYNGTGSGTHYIIYEILQGNYTGFTPNGTVSYTGRNGGGSITDVKFYGLPDSGQSFVQLAHMQNGGNMNHGTSYSQSVSNSTSYPYLALSFTMSNTNHIGYDLFSIAGTAQQTTTSTSATGSFESNAITAPSSVSSMGAIITYQNNAGTNTLNTDVVLKLSADGGSNYSTATMTAMPDFATGIKMAKVNDLSVTAGTSLKYKIEFANQASGSKEARIRGVSLQY